MIDISSLPSMPLSDRANFPKISCVYFVLSGDEVCYIGKAINFCARWRKHHKDDDIRDLPDVKIAYWAIAKDQLAKTEILLIKKYQPRLNVVGVQFCAPGEGKRDDRIRISPLGRWYADLLKVEATTLSSTPARLAADMVKEALDERADLIKRQVQYLADAEGVSFGSMWQKLLQKAS